MNSPYTAPKKKAIAYKESVDFFYSDAYIVSIDAYYESKGELCFS